MQPCRGMGHRPHAGGGHGLHPAGGRHGRRHRHGRGHRRHQHRHGAGHGAIRIPPHAGHHQPHRSRPARGHGHPIHQRPLHLYLTHRYPAVGAGRGRHPHTAGPCRGPDPGHRPRRHRDRRHRCRRRQRRADVHRRVGSQAAARRLPYRRHQRGDAHIPDTFRRRTERCRHPGAERHRGPAVVQHPVAGRHG